MNDLSIDRRVSETYFEAIQARQALDPQWIISVHVGQDVWDYLRSLAEKAMGIEEHQARLFGFPAILEKAAPPDDIRIRATRIIVP